ncbi:hypothetical protein ACIGFK_41075 [Streptomyces sp. NPDC085524]|uniref:hypothetical protein n=1 Tax=Streptomyces sp. NPDC085524 TaxID=3365728 RepID=UPI0037CF48E7
MALKAGESAAQHARKTAQVRYRFVERETADEPDPPLARMLRGGQGGQVRLKLYLTLLWMQPEDQGVPLAFPARAWATLFDLRDPDKAGARRVTEAQAWLEENGFITVSSRPGQANVVTLLDDAGTGAPYVVPGLAANKERRDTGRSTTHRYIQIPRTFWTKGHIAVLSGAGVAMFLALLCEGGATPTGRPLWFSPSDAERRFALKEDVRSKGLRELAAAGLVATRRKPVNPSDFDVRRMRNVHELNLERLNERAAVLASHQ